MDCDTPCTFAHEAVGKGKACTSILHVMVNRNTLCVHRRLLLLSLVLCDFEKAYVNAGIPKKI
jgi:hypothetical protein